VEARVHECDPPLVDVAAQELDVPSVARQHEVVLDPQAEPPGESTTFTPRSPVCHVSSRPRPTEVLIQRAVGAQLLEAGESRVPVEVALLQPD
jgi:hypothetical protein